MTLHGKARFHCSLLFWLAGVNCTLDRIVAVFRHRRRCGSRVGFRQDAKAESTAVQLIVSGTPMRVATAHTMGWDTPLAAGAPSTR